jgi:DNA-binding transcriptional regulator/RsmH inhibitor MraZ
MYLFTGYRDHRLDGKDRIVVPSAYASAIGTQGEGALYVVPSADGKFLEAYPADVYRAMAAAQVPNRFQADQGRQRAFFHTAERLELNGPGRITLPEKFLGYFPKRVVRVCGMNTYLELWDPELWGESVGDDGAGSSGGGGASPHGDRSR